MDARSRMGIAFAVACLACCSAGQDARGIFEGLDCLDLPRISDRSFVRVFEGGEGLRDTDGFGLVELRVDR